MGILEPVLVHDPIGLLAVGGSAAVEDKGLPHPDLVEAVAYAFVSPGRFPESRTRRSICPRTRRVLSVLVAEKVPLVLWSRPDLALL